MDIDLWTKNELYQARIHLDTAANHLRELAVRGDTPYADSPLRTRLNEICGAIFEIERTYKAPSLVEIAYKSAHAAIDAALEESGTS